VLIALAAVNVPVVFDADAEARTLLAVVVGPSIVWAWFACADACQVHLAPAAFSALTVWLVAKDSSFPKLIVRSCIVRLIQNLPKLDILGVITTPLWELSLPDDLVQLLFALSFQFDEPSLDGCPGTFADFRTPIFREFQFLTVDPKSRKPTVHFFYRHHFTFF